MPMTNEKVLQVCEELRALVPNHETLTAERCENLDATVVNSFQTWKVFELTLLRHVLWMLSVIPELMADGRREKAMRWLGCVQGVMMTKYASLETLKKMNMSDPEQYVEGRI